MPRRLYQTTADYVVIAVSPALIMTLVGSLLFFLLAVFYQGSFSGRLHWVMACFVFAAVLIARISIEEGFERAVLFGVALAIAMGLAANKFMEVQGTWIDSFGWAINYGLIGLVWWCAHQLTWDCTVIDDSQDASGEGLLEVAGLERRAPQGGALPDSKQIEGTTSREVPSGWWQRYVEHQRRPHAPGVWVVYFSLAALPLFGFGQWFIPAESAGARRYVFWLLVLYVASGMGLLLTTSFLGLRRYLRQRRIEMPTTMTGLWLSTGAVLVVLLLAFAMLLPRPSAEYSVSRLPFTLGSPDRRASQVAPVPKEGTEDEQPGSAPDQRPDEERETSPENQDTSSDQGSDDPNKQPAAQSDRAARQGSRPSDKGQRDQSGDRSEKSAKEKQERQQDSREPESRKTESDRQEKPSPDSTESREDERRDEAPSPGDRSPSNPATQPNDDASKSIEYPNLQAPTAALTALSEIGTIAQWIFYAAVAIGVLYGLWRSRAAVLTAIRELMAGLGGLWAALWGGRRQPVAAVDQTPPVDLPPAPFSTFADPFATGVADRYSLEELVRYSFEAFEAWAREHGCQRQPDETPHELAREVSRLNAHIAADARNLAELYARAAYARGDLPPSSPEQLARLWRSMRSSTSSLEHDTFAPHATRSDD